MSSSAHLKVLDAQQFRSLAADAASVYGAAMHRSPEVVIQRRDIIAVHVTYRGFLCTGAFAPGDSPDEAAEQLVGFGYGYRGAPGQWWHDIVAGALGRTNTQRWLRDGFELAELHVLPEYQGQGLGRALLTDVLSRVAALHAVLSTPDIESPARLLYRSYGFTDLCSGFHFPGSPEAYAIMGVDL
jgi:ribosomal protein S18 acetylase RimI-like enzyme